MTIVLLFGRFIDVSHCFLGYPTDVYTITDAGQADRNQSGLL